MAPQNHLEDGVISVTDPGIAFTNMMPIVDVLLDGAGTAFFSRVFDDTRALFEGRYPGYQASNTKYHDFVHTVSVVLATTRLLHGCREGGLSFSADNALLTLIAAMFHDVGLIQTENDRKGSGAKYTVGHEERSVRFFEQYLDGKEFSREAIDTGGNFIRCTMLSLSPSELAFSSEETRTCGYIVGSADLLAQMADRLYLEKLLFLFQEFDEARLPGFDTELQLLQKTKDFYQVVAKKRLNKELDGLCNHMRGHFNAWMNIDEDLYTVAIANNIDYLETVIAHCKESFDCYLEFLRRGGIAAKIKAERAGKRKKGRRPAKSS